MNVIHSIVALTFLFVCSCAFSKKNNWQTIFLSILKQQESTLKKQLGYNPSIELLPGNNNKNPIICLHGYGANKNIAHNIKQNVHIQNPLITFNFPDHDLQNNILTFGTIKELLPLFAILKMCVDAGLKKINLYGFSAGGGAAINAIAILNSDRYAKELESINITTQDRKKILKALQAGIIILDSPLKSIDEIITFRGASEEMRYLSDQYAKNNMIPIKALESLKDLSLTILLYFEKNDDILSNRDDDLFYQKLKAANQKGETFFIKGFHGGHNYPHTILWQKFNELQSP